MPRASAYERVRLGWCLALLRAFMRRWGVYIAVVLLVLSGSSDSAVAAMKALAAWTVRPLLHAAAHPLWLAALGTAAHAMAGALVVWGLRPLLWPRGWAEVERALPIPPAQQRRSDALVVGLALVPLFGVYLAGAAVWVIESRGRLPPHGGAAALWLVVSMALSVAAGVAILQRMRHAPAGPPQGRIPECAARRYSSDPRSVHARVAKVTLRSRGRPLPAWRALVLLPLWRGPAQRSGRLLAACGVLLLAFSPVLARWPQFAAWWLGAFASLGLLATSRLAGLVALELTPLHDECGVLPIAPARLRQWRRIAAMLPLSVALPALLTVAVLRIDGLRPIVLAAFAAAAWSGALWQVVLSTARRSMARGEDPEARVAGWLFTLVLLLALASEVAR